MQLKTAIAVGTIVGGVPKVLLGQDKLLPCVDVSRPPSMNVAADLMADLTGVRPRTSPGGTGWVDLYLSAVLEHEEEIIVVYSSILPEFPGEPPEDHGWFAVQDLEDTMKFLVTTFLRKAC